MFSKLKYILISVFVLVLVQTQVGHSATDMLIMGASVSADHSAPSPGKFLAQQAKISTRNIVIKAKDGAKSTHFTKFLNNNMKSVAPAMTIAVDLFFHDFKIPKPYTPKDKQWIEKVVDTLSNNSGFVVIGTALGFRGLGGAQDANELLNQLALEYSNLIIIDVDDIYKKLHSAQGYQYDVNGVQLNLFRNEVMADMIHPNKYGSRVLTNVIIKAIKNKFPDMPDSDLPYLDL